MSLCVNDALFFVVVCFVFMVVRTGWVRWCLSCHCTGDMAVRMREVLARSWLGVCAPCFKFITNCYKFQPL